MLFNHEKKRIEYIIHMFIVKYMQENYHSDEVTFSSFDLGGGAER